MWMVALRMHAAEACDVSRPGKLCFSPQKSPVFVFFLVLLLLRHALPDPRKIRKKEGPLSTSAHIKCCMFHPSSTIITDRSSCLTWVYTWDGWGPRGGGTDSERGGR